MNSVFVSSSVADKNFVDLLMALLKFHSIEAFSSLPEFEETSEDEAKRALAEADALIVVVSKGAAQSERVAKEIAAFQSEHPIAPIVSVLLDRTDPGEMVAALTDNQRIDFTQSMLTGYKELLTAFGREFLSESVYRGRKGERRTGKDRRVSPLIQRMRRGFWFAYTKATGLGKFETVPTGVSHLDKLIKALQEEAQRYHYFDKLGQPCNADKVLEQSVNKIWHSFRSKGSVSTVYLIEAIAEDIHDNYEVKMLERRSMEG